MGEERDPRTYAIIGAAMEVHSELGGGFLEPVYHEALEIEFKARQIPFDREARLPVLYKGTQLACEYRADFVCYGAVVVEIKALRELHSAHEAQLINYLKATRLAVGLLVNFGAPSLQYRRLVLSTGCQK